MCEILDFAFVLLWKRCSEWVPPGGLGFGTGVEPRTVEAMPDSLNICEPCCSIEIPGGLGHRRFVDVDVGAGEGRLFRGLWHRCGA